MASQLNAAGGNGDIFAAKKAYGAMVDTIDGLTQQTAKDGTPYSVKRDFNKLCSNALDPSVDSGCAMFAVNFDGSSDRSISSYFYQVRACSCMLCFV